MILYIVYIKFPIIFYYPQVLMSDLKKHNLLLNSAVNQIQIYIIIKFIRKEIILSC